MFTDRSHGPKPFRQLITGPKCRYVPEIIQTKPQQSSPIDRRLIADHHFWGNKLFRATLANPALFVWGPQPKRWGCKYVGTPSDTPKCPTRRGVPSIIVHHQDLLGTWNVPKKNSNLLQIGFTWSILGLGSLFFRVGYERTTQNWGNRGGVTSKKALWTSRSESWRSWVDSFWSGKGSESREQKRVNCRNQLGKINKTWS